jgi:acetyl-CoA acetyltransferase
VAEQPIKDRTAIVGIGWTSFTRGSTTSVGDLGIQASLAAIRDAGLSIQDIDGVVSYFHEHMDTIPPRTLIKAMGMKECNFQTMADAGGSWNCSAVLTAAMAVYAGVCKHVLVYRALRSYADRGRRPHPVHEAEGEAQFEAPFGSTAAAANFAHCATAHMARFGTTVLDFAHLAVTQRHHASLNTKAQMRKPITIGDHQNSRWIAYPFRLLDCCQQSDGAVALVVTSAERARDLKHAPVYIMAAMGGYGDAQSLPELWQTHGALSAPHLYEGAGITPQDVSFAELYDPFTFMCLTHIEDFGIVRKGEAGAWVTAGHNGLDGTVPINTHGGLLSEAHIHGLNHVIEAVQQLRPEGVVDDLCRGPHTYDRSMCRQVRSPGIGLICGEGGGSSLLLHGA